MVPPGPCEFRSLLNLQPAGTDELEQRVRERTAELAGANQQLAAEIRERERAEQEIKAHQEAIRELSTPVLRVSDRMLIVPIIGAVDAGRAHQLTEQLLRSIRANRARVAVIDITGVATMDTVIVNHLMQTAAAARLLGAQVILTGVSTSVAQTLATLGVNLSAVRTLGDLQSGIEEARRLLAREAAQPSGGKSARLASASSAR